ncbi:MAG: YabP/YqfC family sporulation protein [Clostridia bacterium]|nr:YabP/YqfC family sporulation protein [Clostridia bacterium]
MADSREKKERRGALEVISRAFEIPLDTVTGVFRLESIGGRELTIENTKGILEYSEECVRVAVKGGVITIKGDGLIIKALSADGIYIEGRMRSVEFLEA